MVSCASAKQLPPPGWTKVPEDVNSVFSPTTRELKPSALPGSWTSPSTHTNQLDLGSKHQIGNPIHIYPLYENGLRAHRNQSIVDNHAESAQMYAEFARIAEHNEYAWSYGKPAETANGIGKVTKKNRMICFPCITSPVRFNSSSTDDRFCQIPCS